jgi:hypothetical protein
MKKITVKLKGGLGNQMFQYAFGRSLSHKNNSRLVLDINFLLVQSRKKGFTLRQYSLSSFNIIENKTLLSKLAEISLPKLLLKINNKLVKIKNKLKLEKIIYENNYLNNNLNNKRIYLDGYWQEETYFKEIENIIIKEFTLKKTSKTAEKIKNLIKGKNNPISIHIRRGDYVSNPKILSQFGLCSIDYYKKAIKYLNEKVDNPTFFVFSDDINWAKQNLKIKNTFFISNPKINEAEDIMLMSQCKHHIIANSSFSWWGAWLSNNSDKIVIAPNKWFNQDPNKNIVPKNWKKI